MKVSFNYYNSFQPPYCRKNGSKLSFGSNCRSYITEKGKEMGTITYPFRQDLHWKRLAQFEIDNFKNKDKVNIIQFASSDGSEAYTQIISLLESQHAGNIDKFFPILAYDIDEEVTKAAKSGLINLKQKHVDLINKNSNRFSEYFQPSEKILTIENDLNIKASAQDYVKTYKVANKLTNKVIFNQADMYDILFKYRDNSNTILLCRNLLGYFDDKKIKSTLHIISEKLKKDSLFIIGGIDSDISLIELYLECKGFKEVMKHVYKKIR